MEDSLKEGTPARAGIAGAVGQRQTRQREAIARVIADAAGPLTAREIHARAQAETAALGIATVYRALKLLLQAREIKCVVLPSGEPRYESSSRGHHDHFLCRACEQVFDLGCPLRLPRGTALPGGFVVEDHEMTLFGLCPGCTAGNATARAEEHASAEGPQSAQPG